MKERWLENARECNLKGMKEIYQRLRSIGLQREVKKFKDSNKWNALIIATMKGHLDICQFLVREDLVDVNSKNNEYGSNALHFAVINNQPEIAKWLLEETSIDVNAQNDCGWTALHLAAKWNRLEVTRILLKYKPRLLKDKKNNTALDYARYKKNEEISEEMMKKIFDIKNDLINEMK